MEKKTVNWTPAQSAAISLQGRTLLISAAAGSGKTAVLTERIVRRLTDKSSPSDISRMLIVTFTKAAAAELRARISKAISTAISDDPTSKHLSRQLLLLGSAQISTIHSFCLNVIRKNGSLLGLPDGLSVAGESEMLLLKNEILDEIIDRAYSGQFEEGYDIEGFADFMDIFSQNWRDTGASEYFFKIYNTVLSYPEGLDFLHNHSLNLAEQAKLPFFLSTHGKIITDKLCEDAVYYLREYKNFFEKIRQDDDLLYEKYLPVFSSDISFLESVSSSLSSYRADLASQFSIAFTPMTLPRLPKGYESQLKDEFSEFRKKLKIFIKEELISTLAIDEASASDASIRTSQYIEKLYKLLSAFDKVFRAEKIKLSKLDFTDIERYAFSLLVRSDGSPSELALQISQDYDEIYIDEYQDTNSVQDMIFSAISTPYNRFMVGDIKQSIYSFRGAAPENFASYRDKFTVYDGNITDSDFSPRTIFLSDNFRCDNSVVDFCNRVFSRLFTNNTGRVKYYPSDNLVCSKLGGKDDNTPVNIVLCKHGVDTVSEAEYISHEISRLLANEKNKDGSDINPSDIAILVRNWSSSVAIEEALKNSGVPTHNNAETEFFENPEILLMMSLLNTIDNPMRDIYLAGTLKSPLFGFTLDELVSVRAMSKDTSLYEALIEYTEANNFEKGHRFLDRLDYFRQLTTGIRIDRLIWKLYRECDMFAVAARSRKAGIAPSESRQNLMLLYKYAGDFEASSFKGLSTFIKYIDDIIANKTRISDQSGKAYAADAVRIMTVHQSKGLEYPIVFLAAAQKKRNIKYKADPVLFDKEAGVSIDLRHKSKISKIKTLHRDAIEICIDRNEAEEEMRNLYVALTRARERLYITGEFKDPETELSKTRVLSENLCAHTVMKNVGYMQLILMSLYNSGEGNYIILTPKNITDGSKDIANNIKAAIEDPESFFFKIKQNMQFKYGYTSSGLVPSKISVSELSRDIFKCDSQTNIAEIQKKLDDITPVFMLGDKTVSGADRGTATHIFMQFCDFSNAERLGAKKELERLINEKFLLKNVAEAVDIKKADEFFKCRLYLDTIKPAEKIYREYRFNVRLPASDFADGELKSALENDTLFVQGIIDCFLKNPDGTYTLIDYKTDYITHDTAFDEAYELLKNRHSAQLSYYKRAIESITKCPVSKVYIYAFSLSRELDITKFCN